MDKQARLLGYAAMRFLEQFYTDNQEVISGAAIKSFDEFIKVIFMTLDPRSEYDLENYHEDLKNILQGIGVFFVKSDIKADLREDDWYETVFSVDGKFFKSDWSVFEAHPWPSMGIRHDIIWDRIKEVFPIARTIVDYE